MDSETEEFEEVLAEEMGGEPESFLIVTTNDGEVSVCSGSNLESHSESLSDQYRMISVALYSISESAGAGVYDGVERVNARVNGLAEVMGHGRPGSGGNL